MTAAQDAFRVSCTRHQPATVVHSPFAPASSSNDTAPPADPATIHGVRRPHRDVVRSDSAPNSGVANRETTAPAPVTHASIVSFDIPAPGAKSTACEASRICSGPYQPTQIAPLASARAEVQPPPTLPQFSTSLKPGGPP